MAEQALPILSTRQPGVPLSRAGGLPQPIGAVDAMTHVQAAKAQVAIAEALPGDLARLQNLSPSLAAILRPQAAYRWILPYLASITPMYVESVLRGALAGNHVQAWELFDLMIDTDPEIASCIEEYCNGVLSFRHAFEPWHEEDEEPSPLAIEKAKLVSTAIRGMRPDAASDENAINGTLFDLLFARFHGQSVVEVDWHDTYGSGQLNLKKVPGMSGQFVFPRATFWVHPVCYAWSMSGRLGLRNTLLNWRGETQQYMSPQQKLAQAQIRRMGGQDLTSPNEPPFWNAITSQPRPDTVVEFPRNKFLMAVFKSKSGTALGQSCLRRLAWWWVASNFCGDWLLNYAQLFGIPFRKATFKPGTSQDQQAEIRQMLQSCGSAGYILLPDTAELEFVEAGSGAGQSPQAFLFHFADSQKRKVILHQTMTGGQHDSMGKGGGKAFGEVESETKDSCIAMGAKFAADQINQQLVPMILDLNYEKDADMEAPEFKLVSAEVGGLVDAQRDQVLSTVLNLPARYLRSKYGVPKVAKDDEVAGVDQGTMAAQAKAQQDQFAATQQSQADQADATRKHALELAKTQPQAPKPGQEKEPGQQEQQPGSGEDMEARRAVAAKRIPVRFQSKGDVAAALHETVEPLLDRLAAIEKVPDSKTRVKLMKKLLKDLPHITQAMLKDDSVAKAFAPDLVRAFVEKLQKEAKK